MGRKRRRPPRTAVAGDPEQKTVTFQMQQPLTLKFSDQLPPPAGGQG